MRNNMILLQGMSTTLSSWLRLCCSVTQVLNEKHTILLQGTSTTLSSWLRLCCSVTQVLNEKQHDLAARNDYNFELMAEIVLFCYTGS